MHSLALTLVMTSPPFSLSLDQGTMIVDGQICDGLWYLLGLDWHRCHATAYESSYGRAG